MGYFQCRSPPRRAMTSDGGEKAFDPVLFDVTRISAEEIAEQITKDDFEVFRFIQPDEVTILYLIVSHDSQLVIVSKKIITVKNFWTNIWQNEILRGKVHNLTKTDQSSGPHLERSSLFSY